VLYQKRRRNGTEYFDVVYVGMAYGGIQGPAEIPTRKKGRALDALLAYEVWDNIRDEEIVEIEGLFRFIYRKDKRANILNVQRSFQEGQAGPPE
jgi:hypothetical protein